MGTENHSRYFLVSKFYCARCGHQLRLSYRLPEGLRCIDADPYRHLDEQREPTGGTMMAQGTLLEPCEKCLEPVRVVKEAMQALGSLMGKTNAG